MKKHLLALLSAILTISAVQAQEYPLILNHPGIFKLIDWGVYTHYECGFTKAETTANYQKITGITEAVRKNPVFVDQKGFDCQTYVFAINCPDKFGYGIPSELRFDFGAWFMDKGVEKVYKIEPPNWKVKLNHFKSLTNKISYGNNVSRPTKYKEGFNFEKWKSADDKLSECFAIPGPKEVLGNGIDRYGSELIVVYNEERPPYALPVKFRELAEWQIAYWKLHPDKIQSDMITKMMEDEYAKVPESERDGWAYNNTYDERLPLLKITPVPGPMPVMRLNPEYWNRKLAKSDIQVITFFRLTDTQRYTREKEEALKYNSGDYHVDRFLEALNIKLFVPLIDR